MLIPFTPKVPMEDHLTQIQAVPEIKEVAVGVVAEAVDQMGEAEALATVNQSTLFLVLY